MFKLTLTLILCLSLVLSACGFQLRGAVVLPEAMEVTTIQGGGGELRNELRDALVSAGAKVVPDAIPSASSLIILGEDSERRVLSVDSGGKVREYELFYQIRYSLRAPDGMVLVPEQSVRMTRDYEYDPDNVLSSEQEESAVRDEMRQLAIRQMLRRIQATLRPGAAPIAGEEGAEMPASEGNQTTQ
ncbi:LPS-assembly lipoprotein LptE [Thiohalomonas denitrificans]|uniref:LPS-assembly lipoprotein LptE n=1 Tax=Thiohalomonas denitrificans TaxID=415747 RepID=UPI0026EB376E|nr:LPS assembly lipoprotein LptE [Thiohalomonas denitrificans]